MGPLGQEMWDEKDKSERINVAEEKYTIFCAEYCFQRRQEANKVDLWKGQKPETQDEDRGAAKAKIIHDPGGKSRLSIFAASAIEVSAELQAGQ